VTILFNQNTQRELKSLNNFNSNTERSIYKHHALNKRPGNVMARTSDDLTN